MEVADLGYHVLEARTFLGGSRNEYTAVWVVRVAVVKVPIAACGQLALVWLDQILAASKVPSIALPFSLTPFRRARCLFMLHAASFRRVLTIFIGTDHVDIGASITYLTILPRNHAAVFTILEYFVCQS
jgi:hypothetical protein